MSHLKASLVVEGEHPRIHLNRSGISDRPYVAIRFFGDGIDDLTVQLSGNMPPAEQSAWCRRAAEGLSEAAIQVERAEAGRAA